MRHETFKETLLTQPIARELIVNDRIDRDRGLRQPVRELLLVDVQLAKAWRLDLDEACVADAFDHGRLPLDLARGRFRRRLRACCGGDQPHENDSGENSASHELI